MNQITKAAVEAFETQNNLGVDGIPGPTVWTSLINDVINNKPTRRPTSTSSSTRWSRRT